MKFRLGVTHDRFDVSEEYIEDIEKAGFKFTPGGTYSIGTIEIDTLEDLMKLNEILNENLILDGSYIEIYNGLRE